MSVLNQYFIESVDLLRQMIGIPSVSGHEEKVRETIMNRLSSWGINCINDGNNILAYNKYHNEDLPTLMLSAHIDTVQPSDGYSFDPFSCGDNEQVIWGLGSNDDGGSVVALIATFRYFYNTPLPFNLLLVLSCEEETSGEHGMHHLVRKNEWIKSVQWAIMGEPTLMKAAISERGLLVIDGVAEGKSGHAARDEGINALYKAIEDVQTIRHHRFSKTSPLMGDVKISVTQMLSGTAHNVVPDRCEFVIDVRNTDAYKNTEVFQELDSITRSRLTPRAFSCEASCTRTDSPLLQVINSLGIETYHSPTTSDWMELSCDAIKIGPGDSARSHQKDEYITCDEIRQGIDGYVAIILQMTDACS